MAVRLVAVFVLEADAEAHAFFADRTQNDLQTLTAGNLLFMFPDAINDLFTEKGRTRYPGLERSDLSCLWVEDESNHFIVRLRNLSRDEIRDVLSDLGDSAQNNNSLKEWKNDFDARQAGRHKTKEHAADPANALKPSNPEKTPNVDDNHGDQNAKDAKQTTLLVNLGRIAGIGGIAVGTFFLLLGKLKFGPLSGQQATVFMFLCYGVAIVGMIIWAAQVSGRRTLPIILGLFASLMAIIGAVIIHPKPSGDTIESGYSVRVMVFGPNQTPVQNSHVWSTLGGETKQIDGGWEIDLPATAVNSKRTMSVFAEVAAQGWRGKNELTLGTDYSPSINVELQEGGESEVRGVVIDADGHTVANATVSVVGYKGVPTEPDGEFVLPSHAPKGSTVKLHAETRLLVADIPDYKVGSGAAILVLKNAAEVKKSEVRKKTTPIVEKTHDDVIDRVLANLASLKQLQRPATQSQLAETLQPLFNRPAFYGIREDDWRYFLYALCRTRLILEEYVGQFQSPTVRADIGQAIQRMVILQNDVAQLYGKNFSVTDHIDRYIHDKHAFVDNLPKLETNPVPQFFDARDKQISEIRGLLKEAGLYSCGATSDVASLGCPP